MTAIRPFRSRDAPGVVALLRPLVPQWVVTETGLLHWIATQPPRARPRYWVALEGSDVVGWGQAHLRWEVSAEDVASVWVGVRPDARGRGIGSRLYALAEAHALALGPRTLHTWAGEDPAGQRFARARGFTLTRSEKAWVLDPRSADLSQLPRLEAEKAAEGFRLAPLAELRARRRELFALYAATFADVPSDFPHALDYQEWARHTLGDPELDGEGSFVVLAGEQPVSFAWLLVDRAGGRAVHQMTGTLREFRHRGLARLAKLATIRWAAENGIRALLTQNDTENADMLALNEHLGYRPLLTSWEFVRELQAVSERA